MSKTAVVFLGDGDWRIATYESDEPVVSVVAPGAGTELEETIDSLYEAIHQADCADAPVLLAVPATWCAAASISTDSLPRRDRLSAMAYRLEEKLPLATEEFSAGFISGKDHALGICVILDKVLPITQALEARGLYIHAIIPTTTLLAQELIYQGHSIEADVLLWHHDGWYDTVTLDEARQQPDSWCLLPDDPTAVKRHLNLRVIGGRETRGVLLIGDEADASSKSPDGVHVHSNTTLIREDPLQSAARFAKRIISGQSEPWVDLKSSDLGALGKTRFIQKPLKAALFAGVIMLICLNGAIFWRTQQYGNLSDSYLEQERSLFAELYPGQTPPLAINNRLAGEYKKISGMRGASDTMPPPPATLTLLYQVLDQMPGNVRYRVLEMRIEEDHVYIDGQARTHNDVGILVDAMGASRTLNVENRHTERLTGEKGVSFVIVVSPNNTPIRVTLK